MRESGDGEKKTHFLNLEGVEAFCVCIVKNMEEIPYIFSKGK